MQFNYHGGIFVIFVVYLQTFIVEGSGGREDKGSGEGSGSDTEGKGAGEGRGSDTGQRSSITGDSVIPAIPTSIQVGITFNEVSFMTYRRLLG